MNNQSSNTGAQPDIKIDIARWLKVLKSYWWLFLLSIIVSAVSGQVYLRYAIPLYTASAKLLIKGASMGDLSEASILTEGLGIKEGRKDINNEIQIITSSPILSKAIRRINANVIYLKKGEITDEHLYTSSPVLLDSFHLAEEVEQSYLHIVVDEQGQVEIKKDLDEQGSPFMLGTTFTNEDGWFSIVENKNSPLTAGTYHISIWPIENSVAYYQSNLMVELVGAKSNSSVISIKLIDKSAQKAEDLIRTLIEVYNEEDINDDTQVLQNSIKFIDSKIGGLAGELNNVESDIQQFKSNNKIITEDASSSLGHSLGELRDAYDKLAEYQLEQYRLDSLEKGLLNTPNSHQAISINTANGNTALANLITEYNSLFFRQKKLRETVTEKSPIIIANEAKLSDLKRFIITTIQNIKKDFAIPIANAQKEISSLQSELENIPSVEKRLLEKIRLRGIKEQLYLYLLEKRQETELSLAVTSANSRIIEPAKKVKRAVFPKKKLVLIASILLGIAIPLIIIILVGLFRTSITSEEILKSLTSIPILGRVGHIASDKKIVITEDSKTAVAEMFRSIRTNLNYLSIGKDKQLILLTSTVSGEGKSTIAINLGLTIALSGKKTVVVDMDLRKPKLAKYMNSSNQLGVSSFLAGNNSLEEITKPFDGNPHFSYITSGPIPPNPTELILSENMQKLIDELKGAFDYILFDTPPIGVVTDALLLRAHVGNMLLVVREKYTKMQMVRFLEETNKKGELVRPLIIYNDLSKKSMGGRYGNYYGTGYYSGSGYYSDEK